MRNRSTILAGLTLAAMVAGCEQFQNEGGPIGPGEISYAVLDTTFAGNQNRTFVQVERLGNPLFAEAFIEKREHTAHDAFGPDRDPDHFTDDVVVFLRDVGRRPEEYGRTVAGALIGPLGGDEGDKLRLFPMRAPGVTAANVTTAANVGFLTQVLAPNNTGYGGRKIDNDDVVDKYLGAAFGTALGGPVTAPGLVTDNVNEDDTMMRTTFPYFPAPNP